MDFGFSVEANCYDDEHLFVCDENGSFKNREFFFKSKTTAQYIIRPCLETTIEDGLSNWDIYEHLEKQTKIKIVTGMVVDGVLVFKTKIKS